MTDHLLDKACDLYCHGIARIDTLGPSRRLVFTIRSLESRFPDIVVVKLIITTMSCLAASGFYVSAGDLPLVDARLHRARLSSGACIIHTCCGVGAGCARIAPWRRFTSTRAFLRRLVRFHRTLRGAWSNVACTGSAIGWLRLLRKGGRRSQSEYTGRSQNELFHGVRFPKLNAVSMEQTGEFLLRS